MHLSKLGPPVDSGGGEECFGQTLNNFSHRLKPNILFQCETIPPPLISFYFMLYNNCAKHGSEAPTII